MLTEQEPQSLRNLGNEGEQAADELDALKLARDRLQDALTAERASMASARTELAYLRKELAAAQQLAAWWKGMAEIADRAADRARRRAARVA